MYGGITEAHRRASLPFARASPWLAEPPLPASSPGPGLRGHLPLLMKIHGFISISGVISDTAKHKTGLFPLRPGEPDRMTRLSALAEEGSCRAWKWDFGGGLWSRGLWWRGPDVWIGHNGSRALPQRLLGTNEAFCRDGGGEGMRRWRGEQWRSVALHTYLTRTPLWAPLLIAATLSLEHTRRRSCATQRVHIQALTGSHVQAQVSRWNLLKVGGNFDINFNTFWSDILFNDNAIHITMNEHFFKLYQRKMKKFLHLPVKVPS